MQNTAAKLKIHQHRFTRRWCHSLYKSSEPQSNCLLFLRGHGRVGLQSTQSCPVFMQQHFTSSGALLGSAYLLPAEIWPAHLLTSSVLNNTLINLDSCPPFFRTIKIFPLSSTLST
ncbi:hypothetical protein GOODEAATRI_002298 [Goodea atripinnis]|uniref:Uncharacterized protein n=1 Tax=Goodea atripinnis TaxID=208336 RepID=A0ABV0PUQ8_9TELE